MNLEGQGPRAGSLLAFVFFKVSHTKHEGYNVTVVRRGGHIADCISGWPYL
jgi:hypothetical protein